MSTKMRLRFWLEVGIATITSALLLTTLVWKDWIEIIFRVEPDGRNGSLEWLIVSALLVVSVVLFVLARHEWCRVRTATI
jgi:hypothetical protein